MKAIGIFLALLVIQQTLAAQNIPRGSLLNAAEYFINLDPGEGNGTPCDGVQSVLSVSARTDKRTLNNGDKVFVRVRNARGIWSKPMGVVYMGFAPGRGQLITKAERFVNIDPGRGKAMPVAGSFPGQPMLLNESFPVSQATDIFYLRSSNSGGQWGEVISAKLGTNNITGVELYRLRYSIPSAPPQLDPIPIAFTSSTLNGLVRTASTALTPLSKCAFNLGDTLVLRMKGRNELWGPYATVIMGIRELKLSAPGELAATNVSEATPSVQLTWSDSSGDCGNGFIIERKEQSGFSWSQIGMTASKVCTFLDDNTAGPPMIPGRLYCWRVAAIGRTPQLNSEFSEQTCQLVTEMNVEPTPGSVLLKQNFPNPLSKNTTISWSSFTRQPILLTVHDLLGREIARLVDHNVMDAGVHSVTFDAGSLAPGIYLYRITTGNKTQTRTMIIAR